jgi:hypothetical protein
MKFLVTKNRAIRDPKGNFYRLYAGQICGPKELRPFKNCDDYKTLYTKYAPSHIERFINETEAICNSIGFESELALAIYKGIFQVYGGDSKALRGMGTGQRTKANRLGALIEAEFEIARVKVSPYTAVDPLSNTSKTWDTVAPISKEVEQKIIARVVEIETSK